MPLTNKITLRLCRVATSKQRQIYSSLVGCKLATLLVATVSILAVSGCQVSSTTQSDGPATIKSTFSSLDDLSASFAEEEGIFLVEFCLPSDCSHCNKIKDSINQLSINQQEELTIHSMNLKEYPQFYWEFSVSASPSYVAFLDGEEVFRAARPSSADHITTGLGELLPKDSSDELVTTVQ